MREEGFISFPLKLFTLRSAVSSQLVREEGRYLCLVGAAVSVQFPDVVLLHPPPGVFRVPVWGSLHRLAHVLAGAAAY